MIKYTAVPMCLLALSACADSTGQLNESPLVRDCAPEDAACQEQVAFAPLAVGAEMVLTMRPDLSGTAGPAFQLEPSERNILSVLQNRVVGVTPGVTSVLARSPDGIVIDFVHVWVEKADYMSLHRVLDDGVDGRDLDSAVQLLADEELRFTFHAWRGTRELIGDPQEVWTLEGEGFEILDGGVSGERRVVVTSETETTATLRVDALELSRTLELEVVR